MKKNYLFVCHANLYRSPYAAKWFAARCRENNIEAKVESAGLNVWREEDDYGRKTMQLTEELVEWARTIFVMEEDMITSIKEQYPVPEIERKNIVDLDIPDNFYPKAGDSPLALALPYKKLVRHVEMYEFGSEVFDIILKKKLRRFIRKKVI